MSIYLASLMGVLRVACSEAWTAGGALARRAEGVEDLAPGPDHPTAESRPFLGRAGRTNVGVAALLRHLVSRILRSARGMGRPSDGAGEQPDRVASHGDRLGSHGLVIVSAGPEVSGHPATRAARVRGRTMERATSV